MTSFGPSVEKRNGRLVVRSGLAGRVATMGAFTQVVSFDPGDGQIRVSRRRFWHTRRRRIGFDLVQAVTYGYEDFAPFKTLSWSYNSLDVYSVGLRLFDGESISLGTFGGPGAFVNNSPLPDWCYWEDYLFDFVGSQGSRSEALVEVLSGLLGVTVVPP